MQALSIPAPILNMSTPKLQSALAKSLFQLKSRDQIISTLKTQLKATQASASQLPTSTPPQSMNLDAAAIDAQNAVEEANARAAAAEARTAELQAEVQQLVEASKQGGEAQAAQMQTLQNELSEAKKFAAQCKDDKVLLRSCICVRFVLLPVHPFSCLLLCRCNSYHFVVFLNLCVAPRVAGYCNHRPFELFHDVSFTCD